MELGKKRRASSKRNGLLLLIQIDALRNGSPPFSSVLQKLYTTKFIKASYVCIHMVCTVVYSQMPVVVATFLAILAFITSCFYSILNSAKNNMSTAYFECITFWAFEARRSKKPAADAEKEYTENAVRLLKRANWCAGLYKDYCIIVRWWFSSVILMFFSFLFIMMAALTFSQCSHHEYLIFGFGILFCILFVFSIIFTVLAIILFFSSITFAVIAIIAITIEHPYKSKYLNWKIFWDKIEILNPNLADDKFREFKKEICEIEKLDKGIPKYPQWFEDNKTKCKEF